MFGNILTGSPTLSSIKIKNVKDPPLQAFPYSPKQNRGSAVAEPDLWRKAQLK